MLRIAAVRGGKFPTRATEGSAAQDCYARTAANIDVGERALIPLGFRMALPQGYCAYLLPRSGLAARKGLTVLNSPGLIDSDYRGELHVILINLGFDVVHIEAGDRVCQMLIDNLPGRHLPTKVVKDLPLSTRGTKGFGSTGR